MGDTEKARIKAIFPEEGLVKGGSQKLPTNTTQNRLIDRYVQRAAPSSSGVKPPSNSKNPPTK